MTIGQSNQIERIPGYPVSRATAEKIFCGLGEENWWKQLYDGKYHHLGHKVFDEGLHGLEKEPGFYESALKAFQFVKARLKEKITVEFYQELHKVVCAHFNAEKTKTRIKACEAGQFRDVKSNGIRCRIKFIELMNVVQRNEVLNDPHRKTIIEEYSILRKAYGEKALEMCADKVSLGPEFLERKFTITPNEAKKIEAIIKKQLKDVQNALASLSQNHFLQNAGPSVSINGDRFFLLYSKPKLHQFSSNEVVPYLFYKFNGSLSEIDDQIIVTPSKEREKINVLAHSKLVLIARLYQTLEWHHPYLDGQGRTDLFLLAKLLSENGFTPAILDEPYMSSFSSEKDWVAYLMEGMQKWQAEAGPQILNGPIGSEKNEFDQDDDVYVYSKRSTPCCSVL